MFSSIESIRMLARSSLDSDRFLFIMPTGENVKGTLIWVELDKSPVVGVANIDRKTATVMGGNVGGNAMYIGTLVGDKGTKLKMELICNSFTVKCTGVAVSNDGKTYNVILK